MAPLGKRPIPRTARGTSQGKAIQVTHDASGSKAARTRSDDPLIALSPPAISAVGTFRGAGAGHEEAGGTLAGPGPMSLTRLRTAPLLVRARQCENAEN
jgi:hypothetical protein